MKCPLLSIAPSAKLDPSHAQLIDCIKEECAWWDKTLKTCAISRTANRLDQITYFLAKLVEKMPSPEFFKK